jgi:hypothetical protein
LNGGTTNNELDQSINNYKGTLNQVKSAIIQHNWKYRKVEGFIPIEYADFYEPDLNNALTAVCFICDQRVWDYEMVLEWEDYYKDYYSYQDGFSDASEDEVREKWEEEIGGTNNVFLRELIKEKKLA